MSPAVCSALYGFPAGRRRFALGCLLGAAAMALLAACQGSSCNMSGSSGYQVDGTPGLMACSMTSTTSTASTTPTNPADPVAVAMNTGFNNNGYVGVYYAMPGTATALPAAGTTSTLTLPTGPVHPVTNPNDYAMTGLIAGSTLSCEIASGGLTFTSNPLYTMSGTTATLRVNYPPFMGTGSFTIDCVAVNGTSKTTMATLTVNVP